MVSVLFADLVGFTTLSEHRDAEEVRELLTRYFETCRQIVKRYGGTIEKFIGDAVMAVWGAPTAQEDDAERAVRAALDLTGAVAALGADADVPDLRLRAGVVTGEAAVTMGVDGQGLVAGDVVNTASRVQSVATPGTVLVNDATRSSTQAAITHQDAGSFDLKGKSEPLHLWRAERVVAARRGFLRSTGLEAPFVGREREMHLLKELFHSSATERRAHLVSVVGLAGIGKTRLSWELERYIDGLAETVWWHRGRCLSYGEGVTYWALAEMVRMRAGIAEEESADSALDKLNKSLEGHLTDPDEREWVGPRLRHLLSLEDHSARERADLFAAWRLFFERMSESSPIILLFEDLQWADSSLLDFIEYLLEWSRSRPIFIVTLARPEIADKRPAWGAASRNFSALFLEPLSPRAMEELITGLAPGLDESVRAQILERAEGVPLYAVETVRMLLDAGLIHKTNGKYDVTRPLDAIEVPGSLHALIAARIDGLTEGERSAVKQASVLGKTFTKEALAALTGVPSPELEPTLEALVRKEILALQSDPRSPDRGQYGFLQALVQKVAYDTLSRRERTRLHLSAAEYLEASWGSDEDEIVEVIASHLLEAYEASTDATDAEGIRERARTKLIQAGERASSLGALDEAERYYEQAVSLTDDVLDCAGLHERAGRMGLTGGRPEAAAAHFEEAIRLFDSEGERHQAARVSARLGLASWLQGKIDAALERMEESFGTLFDDEPDEDLAAFAAEVGRLHFFRGDVGVAEQRISTALGIAERLWLPEVLSDALNTKGLLLDSQGHPEEALGLMRRALEIALENDLGDAALRGYFNLSYLLTGRERFDESLEKDIEGLALARKLGNRTFETAFLGAHLPASLQLAGRWDESLSYFEELSLEEQRNPYSAGGGGLVMAIIPILVHRGMLAEARELATVFDEIADSNDVQTRGGYDLGRAELAFADGDYEVALHHAEFVIEAPIGRRHAFSIEAWAQAFEAARALGHVTRVENQLARFDALDPVDKPQYLHAHAERARAWLAAGRDDRPAAVNHLKRATATFRELGIPLWTAVALLEQAEALDDDEAARALIDEARDTFDRLGAHPWLDRVGRALGEPAQATG